jgi:hypothetical protein
LFADFRSQIKHQLRCHASDIWNEKVRLLRNKYGLPREHDAQQRRRLSSCIPTLVGPAKGDTIMAQEWHFWRDAKKISHVGHAGMTKGAPFFSQDDRAGVINRTRPEL